MIRGKERSLSWRSRTGLNCDKSTVLRRMEPRVFLGKVTEFSVFMAVVMHLPCHDSQVLMFSPENIMQTRLDSTFNGHLMIPEAHLIVTRFQKLGMLG